MSEKYKNRYYYKNDFFAEKRSSHSFCVILLSLIILSKTRLNKTEGNGSLLALTLSLPQNHLLKSTIYPDCAYRIL